MAMAGAAPQDSLRTCFQLRLVLASLLFLLLTLTLPSAASPTTRPTVPTTSPPPPPAFNSSLNVIPHCYTPEGGDTPGIHPVALQSCRDALAVLVRTPGLVNRYRFSRNRRAMAWQLPLGWQFGDDPDCRIVASCENDRDTAEFRLADVAQVAKKIMDSCVDAPDPYGRYPTLKWGGVHGVGEDETFYVAVARPIDQRLGLAGGNLTVVETE